MKMTVTRQALGRLGRSLAFRLFLVLLTLYTLYHCVAVFSDRVVTDVIVEGTERTTVCGEAVIVRDETVLTASGGNYLCSYPLPSGAKVNASTTLAQLYTASGDAATRAENQATLNALDRQIALIEAAPAADTLAMLATRQAEARDALLLTTRDVTDDAPMRLISDRSFSLLLSLGRIGALTGETGSLSTMAARLRSERQLLLMSAGYAARTLTVADAGGGKTGGYFYHGASVDGYEEALKRTALATAELADLDAMLACPRREYGAGVTVVGKLVDGYRWSILLPLEPDTAATLATGDSYDVCFTDEYGVTLRMTLDRLIGSRAEGRVVAVLSADETPSGFSYTRFSHVELTLSQTSGYHIPETALTEQDGVEGVYILDGGRVSFRAIEILLRGDGYALVYAPTKAQREDETDSTYHADRYVALHDVVIVEGDDLYDGKYID